MARRTYTRRNHAANDYFASYNSVSALLADARQGRDKYGMDSWAGGKTVKQTADMILSGTVHNADVMRRAQELFDKVDVSFRDRDVNQWMPEVCGAFPIVAEYLQGMPQHMRTRKPIESEIAPLKVYVEASISAGVTQAEITNRGVALAALVMRMSEVRPVELYMFAAWRPRTLGNKNMFWQVKLDTTPVSLVEVINTLAHTSFMRSVNFALCRYMAGDIDNNEGFPFAFKHGSYEHSHEDREAKLKERFNLTPQDIVVQMGYLTDASLMASDPVEWVHRQLEKQRHIEE